MLAATTLADSNVLYLDQTGDGNAALTKQNGNGNSVGSNTAQNRVQQNGNYNSLIATQNGGSKAGHGGSYPQHNMGIDQVGHYNAIVLTQTGSELRSVQQTAAQGTDGHSNSLELVQSGNHVTTRVIQTYTGAGSETGNTVSISQTGSQHQTSRVGLTDGQFRHEYALYFATTLTGDQPGSHQRFGGVVQNGYDNSVDITQVAAQHQVGSVLQQGNGNDFTASQTGGNGNRLTLAHTVGNDNTVTTSQVGASNSVFWIDQAGDDNVVSIVQSGGNNNMLNKVHQTGSHNEANLSFTGSLNGAAGAGALGAFATGFEAHGLAQGDVIQQNTGGLTNSIDYNVDGDSNLFAFAQVNGTGNTINGTVDGNSNVVAVLQNGSGNVTDFTQVGSSNSISAGQ